MSRLGDFGGRLYRGELSFDLVGKRKLWYGLSVLFITVALAGLGFRGLYMGVEFQGGAVITTPPTSMSVEQARDTVQEAVGHDSRIQRLGSDALRIQVTGLDTEQSGTARAALAEELGVSAEQLNAELVGPSWGEQVTDKALTGLLVFLVLVGIYLAITFEWRMAVGALVAVLFDLVITVGVYAIVGFEVTPGTVVGVLTILGYSLYDTVVVFDKVKEKTQGVTKQSRSTYAELANLGINATLARSINTSVVALLPVGGLLFIGSGLLGGGMLRDISLSLFIGLTAGTYSSIVIATPLVVELKNREPDIKEHNRRILARRSRAEKQRPAPATAGGDSVPESRGEPVAAAATAAAAPAARKPAGAAARKPSGAAGRNRGRRRPSGRGR